MQTDARQCILEMTALCRKSQELLRGSFLLLIGAENPDGSASPDADASEEDFLAHAREFLNDVHAALPLEEAARVVPHASGLGDWLRALRLNLMTAAQSAGPEAAFREKQDRYRPAEKEAA